MPDPFKPIFEAVGRGGKDLVAFGLVVAATMTALIAKADPVATIAAASIFLVLWCVMRYVLLRVQVAERLQALREGANVGATGLIERHADDTERVLLEEMANRKVAKDAGNDR